jgi:DNA-directed RNA polymerase specialized sigma24 family protein
MASRNVTHEPINDEVLKMTATTNDIGLQDLLSELPMAQREVIVLCSIIGYDYETAARILDVPVGTVRSRLSRARLSLSQKIDGKHRDVI